MGSWSMGKDEENFPLALWAFLSLILVLRSRPRRQGTDAPEVFVVPSEGEGNERRLLGVREGTETNGIDGKRRVGVTAPVSQSAVVIAAYHRTTMICRSVGRSVGRAGEWRDQTR